jgi:hypothetical protein
MLPGGEGVLSHVIFQLNTGANTYWVLPSCTGCRFHDMPLCVTPLNSRDLMRQFSLILLLCHG